MIPNEEQIRITVLRNAYLHDGRADFKAVINKIMGEFPDARKAGGEVSSLVKTIVDRINSMDASVVMKTALAEIPDINEPRKQEQEHRLPELEGAEHGVVMRLAPSPSGPLHIGHSRMAILNDEYVKRYGGKLILRIEDTNPSNVELEAYDMIPLDLDWLGVTVHETVIQSKRMSIYYDEARKLIQAGHMYVCECPQDQFKQSKLASVACPHRDVSVEKTLEKFEGMISGKYAHGKASAVIKTDLNHPNPSIRDWIAFRVREEVHPLTGKTYFAYPLMNFSVAVDDHHLGLTHVLRGKDHLNNTEKQSYIFRYLGWKLPRYYHHGLVHIPGTMLHTTPIKKGIKDGTFSGWDDVSLGTLLAMKKRGYQPQTFRTYWVNSGVREIDSEFSWEIFNSINREAIDHDAKRLWFVRNPHELKLFGSRGLRSRAPFHPGNPELGTRSYELGDEAVISIPLEEWNGIPDGEKFRLKDLCNVVRVGDTIRYEDNEHSNTKGLKILQWNPPGSLPFTVFKPDGTTDSGSIEPLSREVSGISQFERYAYVNMDKGHEAGYFLHK